MQEKDINRKKVTGATVLDANDKIISKISATQAFYHMRKKNLIPLSQEGTRLLLKCANSNIETLLTSEG